eukprot:12541363-Alexandrium_andersonii.AAC.1
MGRGRGGNGLGHRRSHTSTQSLATELGWAPGSSTPPSGAGALDGSREGARGGGTVDTPEAALF